MSVIPLVAVAAFLAAPPDATDPLRLFPANYQLAFENDRVRVVHTHYGPHEKLAVHSHSHWATVYVYLSDSPPVRFRHIEKPPFALIRPPQKPGGFRVSPGRIEVHEVENLGDWPTDFLRIELKRIPLGVSNLFLRGPAPDDLSTTRLAREYVRPQLVIERAVVTGHHKVTFDDPSVPSLVIAISDARLSYDAMHAGELRWLDSRSPVQLDNLDGSAAHLLRIEFPPAP